MADVFIYGSPEQLFDPYFHLVAKLGARSVTLCGKIQGARMCGWPARWKSDPDLYISFCNASGKTMCSTCIERAER